MLVSPRPGVHPENLLTALQSISNQVANLRSGGQATSAYMRLLAYLEWSSDAVRMLGSQVSSADLSALVLTDRHAQLLGGVGNMTSSDVPVQRVVNGLVSLELEERTAAFEAAVAELRRRLSAWEKAEYLVSADTSFYIHHSAKLRDLDLAVVTGLQDGQFQLLVPILVVDELDGLKRSKDPHIRWRAAHTLGVLDELFRDGQEIAQLRGPDREVQSARGVRAGEVNVEIIYDPPGHVRLPINDDEIVDRVAAMQSVAGRKITFLTYDTGQSSRGRRTGLQVVKLDQEDTQQERS